MHLPPQLALLLTLGFITFLFRREIRAQRHVSGALWVPFFWLFIIGSKYVSEWLNIFGFHVGAVNAEDGSPIDSVVFGLLILSGLYVLHQRGVNLSEVVRNNRWLTVYLTYCFLAILWSDFPFVAVKRWLKVLGHPIMALVILTEPDPEEAIIQLLKRCAYVWVTISVLWIKYFPQLGRSFSFWNGQAENSGIAANKNMLGLILFISAVFFYWYFLKVWRREKTKERRTELILLCLFVYMTGWLIHMSQSSTCLLSFLVAAAMISLLNLPRLNPRYISGYMLALVLFCFVAEGLFGIYSNMLEVLGKSPTLTDRTSVWNDLLHIQVNPIIGTGFESFWLGDWVKPLWRKWPWRPNEAHNCYLETYLNLGLAGLFLLIAWMVSVYYKARRDLIDGSAWGPFRMGVLVAIVFYNWTEANLRGLDPIYFLFFLIAMDYPRPGSATATQTVEYGVGEAHGELASAKA